MKLFLIVLIITQTGCNSFVKKNEPTYSFDSLLIINMGEDSKKTIIKKLGPPKHKRKFKESITGYKNTLQYEYEINGYSRLLLFFIDNTVQSASWDIWEKEPERDISNLLKRLTANWKIEKEPVTNPHAMPSMCYLEDLKKGYKITVDGYKKTAESVSIWNPKVKDKSKSKKEKNPEFCIAGLCSRVTDPDAWKHNHCKWLEKLVNKK